MTYFEVQLMNLLSFLRLDNQQMRYSKVLEDLNFKFSMERMDSLKQHTQRKKYLLVHLTISSIEMELLTSLIILMQNMKSFEANLILMK